MKQAGFILVTVMIFLLIFSLLGIYAINTSVLENKISQNLDDYFKMLYTAENALREMESKINTDSTGQGIEDLGIDDCAHVVGFENSRAHYYRITAMVFDNQHQATFALQSTVVVPASIPPAAQQNCKANERLVTIGRQSWRVVLPQTEQTLH